MSHTRDIYKNAKDRVPFKAGDVVRVVHEEEHPHPGKIREGGGGIIEHVSALGRVKIGDYYYNPDDLEFIAPSGALLGVSEEGGTKHDSGKPQLSLVSKELMEQVARVRAFGAEKYSRDNWRKGFKYTRSIDAALRHIMAFKEGEDVDPESGLCHISHAVCCLEHLLNDIKAHPENDDRQSD